MGLVIVYDADGVEYQKETVDARECIEHLCFSYEKPEPKVEEAKEVIEIQPIEPKTRKSKFDDVKV